MSQDTDIVIASGARTPIGAFNGGFADLPSHSLGSTVITETLNRAGVNADDVSEVILGQVLTAGGGMNPARQASMAAGVPKERTAYVINQVCGSGLRAVALGVQAIKAGDSSIVVAGGQENMTQAPHVSQLRAGIKMGPTELVDSMINDGLWDVYNDIHMGNCAEICARERNYSINDQNDFAKESYRRAIDAQKSGAFTNEIISVNVENRSNTIIFKEDEEPKNVNFEKMDKLSPAFEEDRSITAANASKINDGAACLLLMSENKASELGLKPLARILYQSSAAHDPKWFTTAPIKAIKKILIKANMEVNDIDLWEINEAFAPVVMSVMDDYNLDHGKINVNGGAIALGHPIGASGARILTTLIHALNQKDLSVGLATLCIGGGEASALIIERVN